MTTAGGPPPAPHHNRNPLTTTGRGGRLLSKLQLPWFTLLPPNGYGVLTTTGRKSGRARQTCVRAVRRGDRVFVVAIGGRQAGWFRNLESNPRVGLRIRGGRFAGQAREVDVDLHREAEQAYCADTGLFELLESLMHLRGRPRRSRIRQMHRHWFDTGAPVVIDLE